eukprot:XP_001177482.1 PREDICTED: uncharacterized protein LOC754197 [Strongylocentrotus purpuratus]
MLSQKLAIGLGSLIALKLFGLTWDSEKATVDIDVIAAAEEDEMSTNVYHNGVLFGIWVAGVAISMGRLLSYAIFSGKKGIDAVTQTHADKKEEELSQVSDAKEVKEIKVINQESYIKLCGVQQDSDESFKLVEEHGSPPIEKETTPKVSKEGKGEGSKIEPMHDEKEDKEVRSETNISVYKLPAIKRHHFMVFQDGMKTLRQSVTGKFSLEKINLDGVRNFIFIVAKGTLSQLSELESKVKADFRWLTLVRDPSAELTGAALTGASPTKEPKWVPSVNVDTLHTSPTKPITSPRSPSLRSGIPRKTPSQSRHQK